MANRPFAGSARRERCLWSKVKALAKRPALSDNAYQSERFASNSAPFDGLTISRQNY